MTPGIGDVRERPIFIGTGFVMKGIYKAVKIAERVYWVGAVDWNIRDFHGYRTKRGSTYNAYLIVADKITLLDTVREPFYEEMMARIASVVDPARIEVVVSHHAEMDHSGALPRVLQAVRPKEVYASVMGAKALKEIFHDAVAVKAVRDGEKMSLGDMSLTFLETRMLHWPDSMISYLEEGGVLFSQDAFGMHLASSARFADEIDPAVLDYEGGTYFANILLPYAPLVAKLLDRVKASGFTINMIAPDHGPVWRRDLERPLANYARWAAQEPGPKGVVVYGTMWHSTETMARHIGEGMADKGLEVKVMSLDTNHRSDVAYEILDAGALVVGSSTLNNQMLPAVADVMTYLKGLRPRNLVGAAFGSYGWSGEAAVHLTEIMKEMNVRVLADPLRVRQVPDERALAECVALGARIGEECLKTMEGSEGEQGG